MSMKVTGSVLTVNWIGPLREAMTRQSWYRLTNVKLLLIPKYNQILNGWQNLFINTPAAESEDNPRTVNLREPTPDKFLSNFRILDGLEFCCAGLIY